MRYCFRQQTKIIRKFVSGFYRIHGRLYIIVVVAKDHTRKIYLCMSFIAVGVEVIAYWPQLLLLTLNFQCFCGCLRSSGSGFSGQVISASIRSKQSRDRQMAVGARMSRLPQSRIDGGLYSVGMPWNVVFSDQSENICITF